MRKKERRWVKFNNTTTLKRFNQSQSAPLILQALRVLALHFYDATHIFPFLTFMKAILSGKS
ncbi:hypothetical protein ASE93_19320 [Serratia sp. Leaf50]|nr:hypothetical protein ASE93_19320 [Serratia sp. Leaf50]